MTDNTYLISNTLPLRPSIIADKRHGIVFEFGEYGDLMGVLPQYQAVAVYTGDVNDVVLVEFDKARWSDADILKIVQKMYSEFMSEFTKQFVKYIMKQRDN